MNTTIKAPSTDPMQNLRTAMGAAAVAVVAAAEAYAAGYAKYAGKWKGMVHDEFPTTPLAFWSGVQRVADGRLLPDAVSLGLPRLDVIAQLPLMQQREIIDHGITVISTTDNKPRIIPMCDLTSDAVRLAIDPDGRVRTPDEQLAIIASRRATIAASSEKLESEKRTMDAGAPDEVSATITYRINRGHVVIYKTPLVLTEIDLRRLLKEMKG